jgi:hypothetical protein
LPLRCLLWLLLCGCLSQQRSSTCEVPNLKQDHCCALLKQDHCCALLVIDQIVTSAVRILKLLIALLLLLLLLLQCGSLLLLLQCAWSLPCPCLPAGTQADAPGTCMHQRLPCSWQLLLQHKCTV